MKKTTLIPLALAMCTGAYAQGNLSGYVTFANGSNNKATTLINGVSGTPSFSSGGYEFEILYQADNGGAAPTALTYQSFSSGGLSGWLEAGNVTGLNSSHPPGIFAGGTTTLAGIAGGANAWVEVVGWNNSGTSITSAVGAGGVSGQFGNSSVFAVATGNPNTSPPGVAPSLSTAAGFTGLVLQPIPEPATLVLGGLGAASLLLFRRRK